MYICENCNYPRGDLYCDNCGEGREEYELEQDEIQGDFDGYSECDEELIYDYLDQQD